jgi:hypothetical protein
VVRTFDEYPDDPYWNQWRSVIAPLIGQGIRAGYDELFLAGPSMHRVLLSTMDHYGLRQEPRVTIEVTEDWHIQIHYSTANVEFNPSIETSKARTDEAFEVLTRYLRRLWSDTFAKPLPEVLAQ